MSDASPYVSVKLSSALVNQAREAAQTMRRSVASQIEYWATLGQAIEHAGLTTGDSRALIARQERADYAVGRPLALSPELDALHGHVLALSRSGALGQRTREEASALPLATGAASPDPAPPKPGRAEARNIGDVGNAANTAKSAAKPARPARPRKA